MVEIFQQRDASTTIREGLRLLLPDYRFLNRTNTQLDPFVKPYVTVRGAGTPVGTFAVAAENIHITVYAGHEPIARDLAVLIDGLLLNPSIDWGFSISPGPGLVTAPDDVTEGFVASVTVVAGSPKIERHLS